LSSNNEIKQAALTGTAFDAQVAATMKPQLALYEEWRRRMLSKLSKPEEAQPSAEAAVETNTAELDDNLANLLADTVITTGKDKREQTLAEIKKDVLPGLSVNAKTQMQGFLNSMEKVAKIYTQFVNDEQKDFLKQIASGFADADPQSLIDKDVLRSLDRFDTKQNFLLKSYLNKKPENGIVLGDVLLQARQFKTSFAPMSQQEVEQLLSS